MRLDLISLPRLGLLEAGVGRSAASWDITTGPKLRACLSNQHRLCCARSVLNLLSRWSAVSGEMAGGLAAQIPLHGPRPRAGPQVLRIRRSMCSLNNPVLQAIPWPGWNAILVPVVKSRTTARGQVRWRVVAQLLCRRGAWRYLESGTDGHEVD